MYTILPLVCLSFLSTRNCHTSSVKKRDKQANGFSKEPVQVQPGVSAKSSASGASSVSVSKDKTKLEYASIHTFIN